MISLDTNTIIHYLRGHQPVAAHFRNPSPQELAIPSIVVYEIEYGTLKLSASRRRDIVHALLATPPQVPFDNQAARAPARIRIDLEARRQVIGPMELLIAGT